MPQEQRKRTLTEDDIEALVEALRGRLIKDFYADLGRGIFGIAKKIFYILITGVAAYGAAKGIGFKDV